MKIGVCLMPNVDEVTFFPFVENLGYDSVWVADSQMLFSDCYATLALAATMTRRIRLGTGTSVCGTRIAPVQVSSIATINRLAPGRTFLSVATGNTAMRAMGQPPMRIREYREYLEVLAPLLRGEVAQYRGRAARILQHDHDGHMSLKPRIPLYVSGYGPRAMELAGEFGDGLVFTTAPRGAPVPEALARVGSGAERAGRTLEDFWTCALVSIALLEPGEEPNSDRVIGQVGANAINAAYYYYDLAQERGADPPDFLKPIWRRYCELIERVPAEHRHFRTHEYHYTRLHPGEAELITADLVRNTCLVGTADELVEHLRALEAQGLRELMWGTGSDAKWAFAEAFSRQVLRRL